MHRRTNTSYRKRTEAKYATTSLISPPHPNSAAGLEKIQMEQTLLCTSSGAWTMCFYLWYTVLGALRHRVGHWQMINHHDVLVGLIHRSRRLRTRTDGRAAVLDGSSWRLYLRPLKKLGQGRERGGREERKERTGQTFWERI